MFLGLPSTNLFEVIAGLRKKINKLEAALEKTESDLLVQKCENAQLRKTLNKINSLTK